MMKGTAAGDEINTTANNVVSIITQWNTKNVLS